MYLAKSSFLATLARKDKSSISKENAKTSARQGHHSPTQDKRRKTQKVYALHTQRLETSTTQRRRRQSANHGTSTIWAKHARTTIKRQPMRKLRKRRRILRSTPCKETKRPTRKRVVGTSDELSQEKNNDSLHRMSRPSTRWINSPTDRRNSRMESRVRGKVQARFGEGCDTKSHE